MSSSVKASFRPQVVVLKVGQLVPSREFDARERNHEKYKQIASTIATIGVIEPLVVFPQGRGQFRVLDGHKRLDILLSRKTAEVDCIIATDDEAYTYNRRVNYLSPVGEHEMILRALRHNTEDEIATALNVDVDTIRKKRNLINGICKEAIELLKDRRVSSDAFAILRKMKPVRQAEAAQLMVASQMYSKRFAAALLAGTRADMRLDVENVSSSKALPHERRMRLEAETESLLQNAKAVEESYGTEVLTLSVSCRYAQKLVANPRLREFMRERHPEFLAELDSLLAAFESESAAVSAAG